MLSKKGSGVYFEKGGHRYQYFMLTVFGAVAELEREYILQRHREGIAIAKQQGKYTGRKPKDHPEFDKVVDKWRKQEISAVEVMRRLGMSKTTFYRKIK